jgi:hypothetical protein
MLEVHHTPQLDCGHPEFHSTTTFDSFISPRVHRPRRMEARSDDEQDVAAPAPERTGPDDARGPETEGISPCVYEERVASRVSRTSSPFPARCS